MKINSFPLGIKTISLIFLGTFIFFSQQGLIKAQNNSSVLTTANRLKVTFVPPQTDRPKNTTGGASRGDRCSQAGIDIDKKLTPLVPLNHTGLTIKSRPTLMVYIPETSVEKVFFSIMDENRREHYQEILPVNGNDGVMRVTLPSEAPSLEIGKNYIWSLVAMCNNQLRPDSTLVQGQITRIELPSHLKQQLDSSTNLESAVLYGKEGIWYDTIAVLADLKLANPKNQSFSQDWSEILTSVGLAEIIEASFID